MSADACPERMARQALLPDIRRRAISRILPDIRSINFSDIDKYCDSKASHAEWTAFMEKKAAGMAWPGKGGLSREVPPNKIETRIAKNELEKTAKTAPDIRLDISRGSLDG
jgi:hypothetical protein